MTSVDFEQGNVSWENGEKVNYLRLEQVILDKRI